MEANIDIIHFARVIRFVYVMNPWRTYKCIEAFEDMTSSCTTVAFVHSGGKQPTQMKLRISRNNFPSDICNATTLDPFKGILGTAWTFLFPPSIWLPCSIDVHFAWFEARYSAVLIDQYVWFDFSVKFYLIINKDGLVKARLVNSKPSNQTYLTQKTDTRGTWKLQIKV